MSRALQKPKERQTLLRVALLVGALLATAAPPAGARAHDAWIVTHLRDRGVALHRVSARSRLPFGVPTDVYTTAGGELHVFRFKSRQRATAASKGVDAAGYTVARRGRIIHLDWIAPPHWYRSRKALVLYLGTRVRILAALRTLAGPQFAGS